MWTATIYAQFLALILDYFSQFNEYIGSTFFVSGWFVVVVDCCEENYSG
jgi:hypothetical protein